MKKQIIGVLFVALVSMLPVAAREVVFIGLTGESAPGMQAHFGRLLQGRMATSPGILVIDNQETERLRLQLGGSDHPAISGSLETSLRRCGGDSALVVWGVVKDLSFKVVRRMVVKKQLAGSLRVELVVYDPLSRSYAYDGEIATAVAVDRGYTVEFGDLDRTDQIPVMERERLTDSLQSLAAEKFVPILAKSVESASAPVADSTKTPAADSAKAPTSGSAAKPAADSAKALVPGSAKTASDSTKALGSDSPTKRAGP